ncbi:O-antigen ligase family protein [uncultured Algibacter sp.]|uniref:O-antigen ligase family protein n=1 Tax=uncultured Algibacter sp. TaxID=298659 RepID=UPI0026386820|nr:O-antigen ligase family protein [uncultured Algibacter sp.]
MKNLIYICFLFPLISNILNFQGFTYRFISVPLAQMLAYFNLILITLGSILIINRIGILSKTAKIWFAFYMFYFSFGLLAMALFSNYTPIIRTIIPLIYFIGFYLFLSVENHRKIFLKTSAIAFLVSSFLLIFFVIINFDLDFGGISLYKVDRPGGVYGDANNAALASIITYVLFNKFFVTNTSTKKHIKIIILLIIACSIFLTFSTTGMFAFLIILFINNLSFFSKERIILLFIAGILVIGTVLNLKSLTAGLDLTPGQRLKIDTLVNVVSLNTEKVDNSGRGVLLETLFKYIYENPFIGNGIDFAANLHGHNTYFGVWADAGIFTFIIFIIILITYFKKSIQADKSIRYFCLSILTALCIFMMSLQTIINQPYLLVLFPYIGYLLDEKINSKQLLNN